MSSSIPASSALGTSSLLLGLEVRLPVGPLAVVRLEVEPRVVPGGRVGQVHGVVLGEAILLLPPLLVPAANLRDGDVLLPVMSPVQLALRAEGYFGFKRSCVMLINLIYSHASWMPGSMLL